MTSQTSTAATRVPSSEFTAFRAEVVPTSPLLLPPPPPGNAHPSTHQRTETIIDRDPDVVEWVLAAAAGHCKNCGLPAPFERADGSPYLQVHHIKWLAKRGSDRVTNAVALCPNCHRRFHYGDDATELAAEIVLRVGRLVAEQASD